LPFLGFAVGGESGNGALVDRLNPTPAYLPLAFFSPGDNGLLRGRRRENKEKQSKIVKQASQRKTMKI
jgi:hypothetical protein